MKSSRNNQARRGGREGYPLAQWLTYLETLHPNPIELGLERVAAVARALDLLPVKVPVITIAGTNGKGSTVAVLESLLGLSGRLTGVYTSPHLLRFNERIRVGGMETADEEIIAAFEAIDDSRAETSLTYFEFATLAALWVFRARAVEVIVLEVGLGGRLDAVNIVDPQVAVITRIDLDHQSWLGAERGAIASEKAGILRAGVPAIIADPEPPAQLLEVALGVAADPVICLGAQFSFEVQGKQWRSVLWRTAGEPRRLPWLPLGPLLPVNITAAFQAASLLGCTFTDEQAAEAVARARPRGRCERQWLAGREYVLDVAHNPASVNNLVDVLNATDCNGRTIAIFSAMGDKDIRAMIRAAIGTIDAWFLADQPANPRAATAAEIAAALSAEGQSMVSSSKNLRQAFRRAQGLMAEGDRMVVFGSFFTVAEVIPLLDRDRRKGEA